MNWMERALCKQFSTDFFFPDKGEKGAVQAAKAKAVCSWCPVIDECRDYISATHYRYEDDYGIWGGWTPEDRHRIRLDAKNRRRKERRSHK